MSKNKSRCEIMSSILVSILNCLYNVTNKNCFFFLNQLQVSRSRRWRRPLWGRPVRRDPLCCPSQCPRRRTYRRRGEPNLQRIQPPTWVKMCCTTGPLLWNTWAGSVEFKCWVPKSTLGLISVETVKSHKKKAAKGEYDMTLCRRKLVHRIYQQYRNMDA